MKWVYSAVQPPSPPPYECKEKKKKKKDRKKNSNNPPPTFLVVGWYSNLNWNSNENSTMQRIRHIEVIETNENADHDAANHKNNINNNKIVTDCRLIVVIQFFQTHI